jgi:hypothetical protein
VHAGGEQGWKSGHLEPFLFVGQTIVFWASFVQPGKTEKQKNRKAE